MSKTTDTQSFSRIEIKVEGLEKDFTEHKSKCNREQCIADHDVITKIGERISTHTNEIQTFKEFEVESRDHRNELATNLNLLTSKVADIVKTHDNTSDARRAIIVGILITVISAILIGGFTMIMNAQNSRDVVLKEVIYELKVIKTSQDEVNKDLVKFNKEELK